MRRYRNRFERIYKVRPPHGFYSALARHLNTCPTTVIPYFTKNIMPKSSERINEIIFFIDRELRIAVRPEILWNKENNIFEEQKVSIDYETFREDVMDWTKKNRREETCSIIEEYLNGEILESIALKAGKTRERIRQIILREAELLKAELKLENYRI